MLGYTQLDLLLQFFQQGMPGPNYCIFGDSAYPNAGCIRSYYQMLPMPPIGAPNFMNTLMNNASRLIQNVMMKSIRISIEHWYAFFTNSFRICTDFKLWKLREERPYCVEQLRVCHLLANCLTCCRGNNTANYLECADLTPMLEQYLK